MSLPAYLPEFLIPGGLACAGWGWLDLRLGRSTYAWPQVKGHVLSADIRMAPIGPGRYRAVVRYRYRVDGVSYESDRLTLRQFRSMRDAEMAAYHFPVGATVDVYHHPSTPDRAVLLPGTGGAPWGTMIVGGLLVVAGIVMLLLPA